MSEGVSADDIFHFIVFFLLLGVFTALAGYLMFTYAPIEDVLKWILSALSFIIILVALWFLFEKIKWDWWH